ncbi:MAG TPA: type I-E CRISPR-associated protein Cas6/Cse3/CasE [Fimbriiglobus sp.]|nr:type I-E CRISPR-associated protein Cas6/Cse3/CasE [Fimbriiglobus sp.]
MFLSKLTPDVRSPLVRRDLALAYQLHRTLWRAFPAGDPGRVLFRVEEARAGGQPAVLVQSDRVPDWSVLPKEYLAAPAEYKPLVVDVSAGRLLRFRLRANPTRLVGNVLRVERLAGAKRTGHRVAILKEEDQVAWLERKGAEGGFALPARVLTLPDGTGIRKPRVDVTPEGWVRCDKDGHEGARFLAVRFDGVLKVTDPVRFRQTLSDGVGPAKGFGFGLLSVASA